MTRSARAARLADRSTHVSIACVECRGCSPSGSVENGRRTRCRICGKRTRPSHQAAHPIRRRWRLPYTLSADDPTSRLFLAIQKPRIAATGTTADAGNYATVEFNSGPNAGGQYSIQCYGVADPDAAPRSCVELEGLAPEASVAPQDLPKMYGTVSNDVTGLFSETVDCYVWADGVTGLVDKCQWMGRTDGPWDAYIANNGVTVRCPGIELDGTFVLDGVEYTKRDRAGLDEIVANSGRWSELPTSCTTGVVDMSRLFEGKATINENLSSWDTSAVEDMSDMFNDANAFNNGDPGNNGANPLDAWDTSKVENMLDMFYTATVFNQDVSDWSTGAVTTMNSMFAGATFFNNGDPGNNGAHPLDWADTSQVTDMFQMFYGAYAFNQAIITWDTGAVTTMDSMFAFATSFNQDLQTWVVPGGMSCTFFATGATAWLGAYSGTIAGKSPPLSSTMINANCRP